MMEYRRYRLAFRAPVRTAHGSWAEREGVLVRLQSESGAVGYGEAAPIPWFGTESAHEVEAACRELGGRVDGARLASVPARLGCLRNALGVARAECAGVREKVAHKTLGVAALLPAGRAALELVAPKAE